MVDMVREHAIRCVENFPVHPDNFVFFRFALINNPDGIKCSRTFLAMPFIFAEPIIIFRVHYGIFTLGEWYSPEGIAVAEATI